MGTELSTLSLDDQSYGDPLEVDQANPNQGQGEGRLMKSLNVKLP